jgi:RNA polymerase sigma-70 factor (sigma-E family)
MSGPQIEFDGFVAARSRALLKTAWLLTGDRQLAEDLLQTALAKAYLAWHRVSPGREEAYVRRILVTTYATWWRRAWRRERPTDLTLLGQGELEDPHDATGSADLRRIVVAALADLPPRQRATVVLRYYCDLSEADTADALGCSVGTVKSQAAKGLDRLRHSDLASVIQEGTPR